MGKDRAPFKIEFMHSARLVVNDLIVYRRHRFESTFLVVCDYPQSSLAKFWSQCI